MIERVYDAHSAPRGGKRLLMLLCRVGGGLGGWREEERVSHLRDRNRREEGVYACVLTSDTQTASIAAIDIYGRHSRVM
jgi:hypothetical protein